MGGVFEVLIQPAEIHVIWGSPYPRLRLLFDGLLLEVRSVDEQVLLDLGVFFLLYNLLKYAPQPLQSETIFL